jgi:excisionase family DNA binding protein
MTTAEAAATLGVSTRMVRKHAEAGRIPAARFGDCWALRRDAVLAYAASDHGSATRARAAVR